MESWIEEGRRQISSALEVSYSDAETVCRRLIARLETRPGVIDPINEFRGRLLMVLTENCGDEDDLDPILEEFDKLFSGFLKASDKKSAAQTLVWKFGFLENIRRSDAFEVAFQLIDLFGKSRDKEVLFEVRRAYEFLFETMPEEDDRFVNICTYFGKFLEHDSIPSGSAFQSICDIEECLDGKLNHVAIPLVQSFLESRADHLTEDQQRELRVRLAANYLYVGRFKETVTECSLLLVNADRASIPDYMLWCGEAFLELESYLAAAMYFREVERMLEQDGTDTRLQLARSLLERIPNRESA